MMRIGGLSGPSGINIFSTSGETIHSREAKADSSWRERNHRTESAIVNNRYESSASYTLVPHVNYRWKTEQNNME